MSDYILSDNGELYHYGVKGMKWGVIRRSSELEQKRKTLRDARYNKEAAKINKRSANKTFNDTYSRGTQIHNQLTKAKRDAHWDAINKTAEKARNADKAYKQSKKDYRQAKRDYKEQKTTDKFKKHGLEYNLDTAVNVHNHGFKGAKRIEDRIANKGMSRLKSETIETGRTAAKAAALTIGTFAVAGLVAKYSNPAYQVLDSAGKVVKNFY